MKTSTKLLIITSLLYLGGMVLSAFVLAEAFEDIDLNDPYRNYQSIGVPPFRHLRIDGGNSFAIKVVADSVWGIKVMHSRQSFLTFRVAGDTLVVDFKVINIQPLPVEKIPIGLIITAPAIRYMHYGGNAVNFIEGWKTDTLNIAQTGKSLCMVKHTSAGVLHVSGLTESYCKLDQVQTRHLSIALNNRARMALGDVTFDHVSPNVVDSAALTLSGVVLEQMKKKEQVVPR